MNAPSRTLLTLKRPHKTDAAPALEERLHKVLANAGLGSRRLLEQRIQAGDAKVNGEVATLGLSVKAGDRVEMDGKRFVVIRDEAEHTQVLVYHKPEGVVTTRDDPEGRPTVFEQLPRLKGARWIAVGRLDINTTGLLLLTTDGALANALMHPSGGLEREYICRVHGEVPDEALERLKAGVELEDGPAHFDEIGVISRSGSHCWFRVVIREGRNREVRRMWESQGYLVSRLKRVRYGNIELPRGLKRGHCEELAPEQVKALRDACGAGTGEATLTLQPVIHQRRAAPLPADEAPARSPQAWTGVYHSEARELTAFDRIREEPAGRPGRGRKHGGGGREVNGNVLRQDKPKRPAAKKRRAAAPGQEVFIPRTWSAGDEFGRAGKGGRAGAGAGAGARGPGRGNDNRGNRGPRDDNFGNRAPAGESRGQGPRGASGNAWGNAAPGGRPAGRTGGPRPGGGRPGGGKPGGSSRPGGGGKPGGGRPGGSGRPGGGGRPGGNRGGGPRGGNFNR